MTYTAAIIGTGPDPDERVSGQSFAMGYRHARAYDAIENETCELVACADIVRENAEAFADEFNLESDRVFEDHRKLLETVEPDIVSVCVPPGAHAELTVDCARAGVRAVHCEKPMADTWGKSRLMAQTCWRRGVQLTFNHQLRFHPVVRRAKELLDEGVIGDLERIELSRKDLFDAGSHQLDLANYFADDVASEWIIGQFDYREENRLFGVHNENQALAQWRYESGVYGLAATGFGADMIGCSNRLVGSYGTIEFDFGSTPQLHLTREGRTETTEFEQSDPLPSAVKHIVDTLGTDKEPIVSARRALNATELIFGTYESARRNGRVEFPLEIDDNPLESMVESGAVELRDDSERSN